MKDTNPIAWLRSHSEYFSDELNGSSDPPITSYLTTLPLIDRSGKILDLGSGNGMLLKFLMEFSRKDLIPYGVEKNKKPSDQAKEVILPEFAENFTNGDVNEYDFKDGPFDIIITNPYYGNPTPKEYIHKCFQNLAPNGMILLRLHLDVMKWKGISSAEDIDLGEDLKVISSSGGRIEYGRIYR